jgi:uncharacterized protein YjbI with pentapeptide repeats
MIGTFYQKGGHSLTELYIFSQDDQLQTVITQSTGLVSALFREELNKVSDTPFSFTVEADTEESQYIKEENQVVFRDKDGDLRLYVIKELDDSDGAEGPETTAICEPAFMELKEHIIEDRRFTEKEAQIALDAALEGTRWTGEVEVSLGKASTNFYYLTSIDAIWNILEVWGGDFKDVVEFEKDSNKIASRVIKLQQRRGVDRGQRFEIDHNITQIERTIISYPVTAMFGRGASLETEGGGNTRYIDFADAEWKVANGDPIDKLKGQKWVGDPDALKKYGRLHEGKLLHREGIFSNQDYETAEELLQATWQALQEAKGPEVNYSLSVQLLEEIAGYEHEHAELGDTARAIDRRFSRPIEIQSRIIAMEYDLVDIEGTATVEMGQFLSVHNDSRLERVIETINNNRGNWEHVTDKNLSDAKPETPSNVAASGLFRSIKIDWDYAGVLRIKNYELYGSQVKGFVPQPQHLLYRGIMSSFSHPVETDQTWYYRIRAVNHHGLAGDYSREISASTIRVVSEDILFGEEIAAKLRELSMTAQLLADGSINFEQLTEEAREQIKQDSTKYTDDEVNKARDTLIKSIEKKAELEFVNGQFRLSDEKLEELNTKLENGQAALIEDLTKKADLEFVNGKFKFSDEKLQELDGDIVDLIDKTITYDKDFVEVKQSVDDVKGSIDTTIRQVKGIDNTVQEHQLQIEENAEGIKRKVSTDTYKQDSDAINRRFENVSSEMSQQAGLIQQRVTETKYNEGISGLRQDIENIQVGGRNYLLNTTDELKYVTFGGWDNYLQTVRFYKTDLKPGDIVTGRVYLKPETQDAKLHLDFRDSNNSTYVQFFGNLIKAGAEGYSTVTVTIPEKTNSGFDVAMVNFSIRHSSGTTPTDTVYYKEPMLEKGNKPSAWERAPEDYLNRFIKNEADIKQYADLISQKVSQTVYKTDQDKVVQQLADHTSLIEQTAKKIESKVESSTVNNLQQTVSNQSSTIEQQAKLISQKVDSTTYNGLKGTVDNHSSQIQQQVDLINLRVTEETYEQGVKNLQDNIDGIQVGGTNLILNTSADYTDKLIGEYYSTFGNRVNLNNIGLKVGDSVTISFYVKVPSNSPASIYPRINFYNSDGDYKVVSGGIKINPGEEGFTHFTTTVPEGYTKELVFCIYRSDAGPGSPSLTVQIKKSMGEVGNKPTSWNHAPEDYLNRFEKNESDITANAKEINLKVSSEQYTLDRNGMIKDMESQSALIQQNANAIRSKVDTTIFNSTKQTVESHTSTIKQLSKSITSKVDVSTYNKLKGTVDNHTSIIEQQANQISQRVTSEKLTEEIEKVKVKQYTTSGSGSDNYGKWTKIFTLKATARYQHISVSFSFMGGADGGTKTRFGNGFARLKQQSEMGQPPLAQLEIRESTGIAASDFVYVIAQNTSSVTEMDVYIRISNSYEVYTIAPLSSSGNNAPTFYENQGFVKPVPGNYVYATKNLVAGDTEKVNGVDASQVTQRLSTAESEIKQQADNIELRVRKDGIVSALNVSSEGVRIDGRLHHITGTTLIDNSVIKAAHIANAAIGNAAIANASISRAKLQNAIIGNAQIENGAITNAKIADLSADKITVGTLKGVNVQGARFYSTSGQDYMTVIGGDIELSKNDGTYLHLNPNGLFGYNSNGSLRYQANATLVTTAAFGTSNTNAYIAPMDNGEARVVKYSDIPGDGFVDSYSYLNLRADGIYANFINVNTGSGAPENIYLRPLSSGEARVTANETTDLYRDIRVRGMYANSIDFNNHTSGDNMYIRPLAGTELRVTAAGTTNDYQNLRANGFYGDFLDKSALAGGSHIYVRPAGGSGELRVTVRDTTSTYQNLRADQAFLNVVCVNGLQGESNHLYLQTINNGEVRATANGNVNAYRGMRAREFLTDTSLRSNKRDIELYQESSLDVWRKANIYTYRRLNDDYDAKLQLGMMLDELPELTHSEGNDSFALYALTSYVAKGLKDLLDESDRRFTKLQKENDYLKLQLKTLEQKIA